jgi:hypothetical protein
VALNTPSAFQRAYGVVVIVVFAGLCTMLIRNSPNVALPMAVFAAPVVLLNVARAKTGLGLPALIQRAISSYTDLHTRNRMLALLLAAGLSLYVLGSFWWLAHVVLAQRRAASGYTSELILSGSAQFTPAAARAT